MKEKLYYVYRHIRPDTNEVFYIGMGRNNSRRAWETRKRNPLWNNIYNKNNQNIEVEIFFDNLTKEEAENKEIEFIKLYGRIAFETGTLSNFDEGGEMRVGQDWSEDEKKHLASFHIGNKHALGFKHSEESCKKMSEQRKGRTTSKKGQTASEETKKKMSESHKGNSSNTGKIFINNGIEGKIVPKDYIIPEGWIKGRLITWKITGRPKKLNN